MLYESREGGLDSTDEYYKILDDKIWMCSYTRLVRSRNDHIHYKLWITHNKDKMKEGCLRWFGNILHRPSNARRCNILMIDGVKRG